MMAIRLLGVATTCLVIDPYDRALDPFCLPLNFLDLESLREVINTKWSEAHGCYAVSND
jgi:hypothetical protein